MSDLGEVVTPNAPKRPKHKKVRTRRRRGAGGVSFSAAGPGKDCSTPSQKNPPKGLTATTSATKPIEVPRDPVKTEPKWDDAWPARVYAVPLNPHLLLIEIDGGLFGRLRIKKELRERFRCGKRLWVKREGGDVYNLVGSYNHWGVRIK